MLIRIFRRKNLMIKKRKCMLIAVLLILMLVWLPTKGYALERLPDIGIDYKTMNVNQAVKVMAAGMRDVKNGDKIIMRVNEEGVRYFKNLRTNQEIAYPPIQPEE